MFQDVDDLNYKFKIKGIDGKFGSSSQSIEVSDDAAIGIAAKSTYLNELRSGWSALPAPPGISSVLGAGALNEASLKDPSDDKDMKKFLGAIGGPWAERFSLALVSPSVVPNFFPTLRVIEYNITGLENDHPAKEPVGEPAEFLDGDRDEDVTRDDTDEGDDDQDDEIHDAKKKHKKKKGKHGKKKPKPPKFPVPKPPSKSSPPGPGYSPQPLSLTSFTQYYANLTHIHEQIAMDKKSKHNVTKHFKYKVEYTTKDDKYYGMADLTVRSMLDLAERIGRDTLKIKSESRDSSEDVVSQHKAKTSKNRLWKEFIKRAFVHTKPDEEIDQDFG
jgi:endopolyphosphatase